ncbi:uncharacterized protein [Ptychodera flava]|uniref:uncharacterized protein n=1 Tax=Ptychodera flava TaxID=63121 RepID=UPI003969DBBF
MSAPASSKNPWKKDENKGEGSSQSDKSSTSTATGVSNFSKYLGSLADKIGDDDLNKILFHADELKHQPIHKREREKIKDPRALFAKLKELGHLSDSHYSTLAELLETAKLVRLAIEVKVRYRIGFHEDITDGELKDMVNAELIKSEPAKEIGPAKDKTEAIGGTKYIGNKKSLNGHMAGAEWMLRVLGSVKPGTGPGQFNKPQDLTWHGDQLVICDRDNNRIQILNKNKVVIEIIRFDGRFDKKFRPYAVFISDNGDLFVTDVGNNQIIICDKNRQIDKTFPQSADIEVKGITVIAACIFVTDSKGKSLIKYNIRDGKPVKRVRDQFVLPHSVMATSNNHLLVSDEKTHVIHVLDSDLNYLTSYRNDRLKNPRGLDVDSHGNIYIATKGRNGIVKLRFNGQFDCLLFEGLDNVNYPGFIAVTDGITMTVAISQPSSWWSPSTSFHQIRVFSLSK